MKYYLLSECEPVKLKSDIIIRLEEFLIITKLLLINNLTNEVPYYLSFENSKILITILLIITGFIHHLKHSIFY